MACLWHKSKPIEMLYKNVIMRDLCINKFSEFFINDPIEVAHLRVNRKNHSKHLKYQNSTDIEYKCCFTWFRTINLFI